MFRVNAKIGPGNIVVKDIKGTPLFKPRLLKSLKSLQWKLFKDKKTYLNITATFAMYIPVIRTKGVRFYAVSLIICL